MIRGGRASGSRRTGQPGDERRLQQSHPRESGSAQVEGHRLTATSRRSGPFDEAIGKIGFESGKVAECQSHCSLILNHKFRRIEKLLHNPDQLWLFQTILTAENPNQFDQRDERDKAWRLGGEGLKKLISSFALGRIVLNIEPDENIGVESLHRGLLNPRRSIARPIPWQSCRSFLRSLPVCPSSARSPSCP